MIKIKKLHPDAQWPTYAFPGDSGADLYAVEDRLIRPMERCMVPIGLAMEIPMGYEVQIRPKSGLAAFYGLTVLNTPGTIDAGYRGEIQVLMINLGNKEYQIKAKQKIAQMVYMPVSRAQFMESELTFSDRNQGGFGSTGV